MHIKHEPWFDEQCRRALGLKHKAHLLWARDCSRNNWEEFVLQLEQIVGVNGVLVCESVGKADLLFDYYDINQSRESVDLPLICHLSPSLISLDLRSSEVRRLLFDLDPYFSTDPLDMFPLYYDNC